MGRLERKLNLELITRIEANGSQAQPKRTAEARRAERRIKYVPSINGRSGLTYRGARRNSGRWVPTATRDGTYRGPTRRNQRIVGASGRGTEFIPLLVDNPEVSATGISANDGGEASQEGAGNDLQ